MPKFNVEFEFNPSNEDIEKLILSILYAFEWHPDVRNMKITEDGKQLNME